MEIYVHKKQQQQQPWISYFWINGIIMMVHNKIQSHLSFRFAWLFYYNSYVITSCGCVLQVVCIPKEMFWTLFQTLGVVLDIQISLDNITSRQPYICKVSRKIGLIFFASLTWNWKKKGRRRMNNLETAVSDVNGRDFVKWF